MKMASFSSALLAVLLLCLGACSSTPARQYSMSDMDIVASDNSFALVRLKPGQDFEDIAQVFLGSRQEVWQLREVNGDKQPASGQVVAVPLNPTNVSSVYADGYRTLPILCYHQFTRESTASQRLELTAETFEEQLQYLLRNDYQLLSFSQVEQIMQGRRPIPERAVVLTIDDGYRSVYDVAWPLLKKYQARATLFVYTDFIGAGKALTWEQLREMQSSGLIEVQSHGKSHTSLARLPEDKSPASYKARVRREISAADAVFKREMGKSPVYLSYPYGNSSVTAARLLSDEGYGLAATVTRGDNTVFSDAYLLHRSMIYNGHDIGDFATAVRNYKKKSLR